MTRLWPDAAGPMLGGLRAAWPLEDIDRCCALRRDQIGASVFGCSIIGKAFRTFVEQALVSTLRAEDS